MWSRRRRWRNELDKISDVLKIDPGLTEFEDIKREAFAQQRDDAG